MPIEFRCDNVAGFDAALGTYQKCSQKLKVPEKFAGKSVKCPKCSQPVVVPNAAPQSAPAGSSELPAAKPEKLAAKKSVMDVDFESQSQVSSAAFKSSADRCPKCGGKYSDNGICTLCNYAEPVKKAQRDRAQKKTIRPAGLQLWLMQLSTEPKNAKLVGYCFFGALNLFALLAIAAGILSTSLVGALIAAVAGFMLFFGWAAFLKTRQLASDPQASLGIFTPAWNILLTLSRKMNWQQYDGRFKGRTIVDLRNQNINDENLPGAAGFKNAQVIDLQGCSVSDSALRHLYGHHHLHCLVIKDTKISKAAAANLQQALPRIWIWH